MLVRKIGMSCSERDDVITNLRPRSRDPCCKVRYIRVMKTGISAAELYLSFTAQCGVTGDHR